MLVSTDESPNITIMYKPTKYLGLLVEVMKA